MILSEESKDWFENYSKAGKDATKFNKILSDTIKSLKSSPNKEKKEGFHEINRDYKKKKKIIIIICVAICIVIFFLIFLIALFS